MPSRVMGATAAVTAAGPLTCCDDSSAAPHVSVGLQSEVLLLKKKYYCWMNGLLATAMWNVDEEGTANALVVMAACRLRSQ
jgi:hypothetical protein